MAFRIAFTICFIRIFLGKLDLSRRWDREAPLFLLFKLIRAKGKIGSILKIFANGLIPKLSGLIKELW